MGDADSEELIRDANDMALGDDTKKMLAVRFPNSHHLLPEFEGVCADIKQNNRGKSHVEFTAQGLDIHGRIIVKFFDVLKRRFCHKDDDGQYVS